jgi:hypothetical protein
VGVCLLRAGILCAQDDRRDYPALLSRGYVDLNIGHIGYPFSQSQLEPGHQAESIDVPNLAVRLTLGYRFNDYVSTQLSYLRPVHWVEYRNIDGDNASHSVWMNVTGLTVKSRWPVNEQLSLFGEWGLGIVTRHGIENDRTVILRDAVYATPLLGAGIEYRLTPAWGLSMNATYSPARSSPPQPHTASYSGGVVYTIDPGQRGARPSDPGTGYLFPKHLIQIGYTTSALGYGFNKVVAPIFWQGDVDVDAGVTLHYQRNVFHTRRIFSLDWGTSLAFKTSRQNRDDFLTVSVFPLFRFTVLRTAAADLYFGYSLAGPTFISKSIIDGQRTGRRFTFQDLLGIGVYAGKNKRMNAEIRVGHYSNGNLLPRNPGIKVPLTLNVGYAFSDR